MHPLALTTLGVGAIMLNPYWYFFPLAWVGFGMICIPIFRQPNLKRDILLGYLAGLGFWCSRIHSIVPAYGWEMFLKCICLGALPWAVFAGITSLAAKKYSAENTLQRILIPTVSWALLVAAFRASPVDGFPTEFMFYQPLAFMQIASIPHGVTFFVALMMLVNVAFALWILERNAFTRNVLLGGIVFGILIGIVGAYRLSSHEAEDGNTPIAIIQTNLPISYEWRVDNGDEVVKVYREMAMKAAEKNPEIIFFSQYSFSMFYSDEEQIAFFSALARDTNAHIAVGTYTDLIMIEGEEHAKRYNIAYVFSPEDGIVGSYRAASNLPFREIGEAFGETYVPIQTPVGKIGVMLCYDDMVRKISKEWSVEGAEVMVVLSNPSTFSSPIVHHAQLVQDQFRAIETGKTLVRSSTNGVSGVVDKYGRWKAKTLFGEQTIVHLNI